MLIIGSSGFIGGYLFREAKRRNIEVIGTYNNNSINKDYIKFDLERDNLYDLQPLIDNIENKVAIICSAISNIDKCFERKQQTININVNFTIHLIEQLVQSNYKIIYLSTDNVFDGNKGNYNELDFINPINIYGFTKSKVEEYLSNNVYNSCILRLSKVVSSYKDKSNIFYNWYNNIMSNETIYCIKDNIMSVVDIDDVVKIIFEVINNDLRGIYNISTGEFFERIELLSKFLRVTNLNTNIVERKLEEFNFKDNRPLKTYMNNKKILNCSDIKFNVVDNIIRIFKKIL